MEPVELEIIRERIKIARNTSWLRSRRRVGRAFAPASAVEGDDAVSSPGKARDLVRPNGAGAGVGVEQDEWRASAAGVREPQFHAGKFNMGAERGIFGSACRPGFLTHHGNRAQRAGQKYAPLHPGWSSPQLTLGSDIFSTENFEKLRQMPLAAFGAGPQNP
jgi:hypothetical protein